MFTHSTVVPDETIVAGKSPSWDLPVSPLSHLCVTVKFCQDSTTTQIVFASIPAMIDKLEVLYKGASVCSMSGIDLLACGILVCDFESWGVNATGEPLSERSFTFLVPFGRQLYSPVECYPSTSRGELVLQITWAATFTTIDTGRLQVEAIELPDAHPERFLKMTTSAFTPTGTKEFDMELPIGNPISDIVLWGTTVPTTTSDDATIKKIQVRKNNSEYMYSTANFDTLHNMMGRLRDAPGNWGSHTHDILAALAAGDPVSPPDPQNHILSNHLLIPFDVRRDGVHILRTDDAKDLNIRIKPDLAEAVRVIPCEVVSVGAR